MKNTTAEFFERDLTPTQLATFLRLKQRIKYEGKKAGLPHGEQKSPASRLIEAWSDQVAAQE